MRTISEDFHLHSSFSDGKDSPEEMVEAALAKGMRRLGFSDHGYASCDTDCCIPLNRVEAYRADVAALREKYRGRIEIYCGIEQDFYSELPPEGYDYVIGSVHYLRLGGEYYAVDWEPDSLYAAAAALGGDMYAVAEEYYRTVARVCEVTGCDIIGHFDLIKKLNGRFGLFDPAHPRYVAAWRAAADTLLSCGVPFEINTGGVFRGCCAEPYPAADILRYLADRGASFVLSSDSHSAEALCFGFAEQTARAAAMGLRLTRFAPPSVR